MFEKYSYMSSFGLFALKGGAFFVALDFALLAINYFLLTRPIDKRFPMKNYTLEYGVWYISMIFRGFGYSLDIVLMENKHRKRLPKFVRDKIEFHIDYNRIVYERDVDIRQGLHRWQIWLAYLQVFAMLLSLFFAFLGAFDWLILGNRWPTRSEI